MNKQISEDVPQTSGIWVRRDGKWKNLLEGENSEPEQLYIVDMIIGVSMETEEWDPLIGE